MLCVYFAVLAVCVRCLWSANILVVSPSLSPSLLNSMGRIADTLAASGWHNVTVWIPEMRPDLQMNGTLLAQRVIWTRNLTDAFDQMWTDDMGDPFSERAGSYSARLAQDWSLVDFCESILHRKGELESLRSVQFDLLFSNMIDLCYVGLAHFLNIPRHIWVSTGPLPDSYHWFLGVPEPLSVVPTLQETVPIGPRMNVWERARNLWEYVISWYSQWRMFRAENALFRSHFSDAFPQLEELAARTDLAFVIGDEFIDPALPTLEKVIPIGGLGISQQTHPLEEQLLRVVESGREGAVFFSLGSNTDTVALDERKKATLFDAFAAFPDYAFVIKVSDGDQFSKNWTRAIPNVHLFDWVAQTDLLAHANLRLFISHSGHNSVLEAAIRGVPLLAIPLYFDQFRNAKVAEYRGFARMVTKTDLLDGAKLKMELHEMLANPSYKGNALRLAKLFREKPHRPEQRVLEWTEFLLANGPLPELVPESALMPWWAYFCADIALAVAAVISATVWLLCRIIGCILRRILCGNGGERKTARMGRRRNPKRQKGE